MGWDTAHDIFDVEVGMDTETSQVRFLSDTLPGRYCSDISYEKTIVQD